MTYLEIVNKTLLKIYAQNLLSTTYSLTYNSPLIGATVSYTLSPSQSGSPSTLELINGSLVGTTCPSYLSFANSSWAAATITAAGALIYNNSRSNAAVASLSFGGDKTSTSGTFTVIFPTPDATSAIIRIA